MSAITRAHAELREILRRPNRLASLVFVVELAASASGGYYECTSWSSPDEVVRLLSEDGFTVMFRVKFAAPWTGEHVCLRAPSDR
jgi:hypothetical protein